MAALARTIVTAVLAAMLAAPAFTMFALVPADRVDEVPVERLLANLQRNAQNLPPAQLWRAIGRVHLLAYLRQTAKLPVYRDRPSDIAEGRIDDCAVLDAQASGKGSRENWPAPKPGERCEARSYSLGPSREIPNIARLQDRKPSPHLRAATNAYGRAKALEPGNLRTRLALAFVLDRSARLHEARGELRFLMIEGLKRLPANTGREQERSDWDTHVVLSEAVEHFSLIARSRADRRLIAQMKERLDANPPAIAITPILVPLKPKVAFDDLIDRKSEVMFDFTGQGQKQKLGWLSNDAAWLVWDPKAKGKIESGFQLFGSVTWLAFWDNGYEALGTLDDNGDGRIAGKELKGLALWHDANGNGISEKGEVRPVTAHGIVALRYTNTRTSKDLWTGKAGVTFRDGETRPTYDWQLRSPDVLAGN